MPFAQFSRIAEQNSFPAELEAITPYVLNTPDGHRFEFAIIPEENPYKARITRYDQADLADPYTLPLVEGPFLTSPAHDGDIQIRHQHCPNELLLDYRDALHPSITDNTVLCDHWQLNLAQVLIDYGIRLWSATHRSEALSGFDEALGILRKLIAAGGLQAHGATFISWVGWPAGEMLREDGQNARALALYQEAVGYARQLADPAQLAGALIGQGIAQWGIPDRPGAFTGFDEALGILRKLIAAGGLQAHGATFISWVGWPAARCCAKTGRTPGRWPCTRRRLAMPASSPTRRSWPAR